MMTMAASEVPVARRSSNANQRMSRGTMTVPPPTPNRPENTPAVVPMAASFRVRPPATARHTRAVSAAHPAPDSVSPDLSEALAPLRADPSRTAVLLDIDGTLAPIVRHAEDAHVPEDTRIAMVAVARQYRLVACVSGRTASDARRVVSIGSIAYIGNHGGELLRPGAAQAEVEPEFAH